MTKIIVKYEDKNNTLHITCPSHYSDQVRLLPNRRWSYATRCWIAPNTERNANELKKMYAKNPERWDLDGVPPTALATAKPINNTPFPTEYKFKTQPYPHQVQALNQSWSRDYFAYFMEMGTGKTKTAIDLWCCRYDHGLIKRVIILCPGSLCDTWASEIATHGHGDVYLYRAKTTKRNVQKQIDAAHDSDALSWHILGIESLSQNANTSRFYQYVTDIINKQKDTTGITIDEAHSIKTPKATRTKNAVAVGRMAKYRLILTGTPITQGPGDLFSLFNFLDNNIVGIPTYYAFKERYVVLGGFENKMIVGYKNIDELMGLVSPHSYIVKKTDCLDLPDKVYMTEQVELSPEQRKVYDSFKRDSMAEINNKNVTCDNVLTMYLRLQQVVTGMIPCPDTGNWVPLIDDIKNPKFMKVLEIIERNRDVKYTLWCKFRWEVETLSELIAETYDCPVGSYHGGLSPEEKTQVIEDFRGDNSNFLVASQQVGGTGLTLTECHTVIYLSNTFSTTERMQSEDRFHRIGQKNNVTYVDIVAQNTVDERILDVLKKKKDLSKHIVDTIQAGSVGDLI